jgi:outer membrane protein TolC
MFMTQVTTGVRATTGFRATTGLRATTGVRRLLRRFGLGGLLVTGLVAGGCQWQEKPLKLSANSRPLAIRSSQLEIEYPDLQCETPRPDASMTPNTLKDFEALKPQPITLEDAIRMTLERSPVLQKMGGQVVTLPALSPTIYDPALAASDPNLSSEAALSAFDAQFTHSMFLDSSERRFNNLFFGAGAQLLNSKRGTVTTDISKTTAAGTTFSLRNLVQYDKNNSPANLFPGAWDNVTLAEVRQPLLAGAGTDVTRIAGPNARIGNYNGVLVARIREDVALADFEIAVRDLVRDVEMTYWQLYFTYQDLDTKLKAQEEARLAWESKKIALEKDALRLLYEEPQVRQQYFNFRAQVENAIVGTGTSGTGLYNTERQLRRLMDLPVSDGTLLRPTSAPNVAPIHFDWQASHELAMENRTELRRQRWIVRQRELELVAAKNLSQWRMDLVANYANRGFGDDWIGNQGALRDQLSGDLDDWRMGLEVNGPFGRRAGHLGVKNAELSLARERVRLDEQQKQLLNDLSNAYSEVDRAYTLIETTVNARIAIQEEVRQKQLRTEVGTENVFFKIEVLQRAATAESAVHRAIVDYNTALLNYALVSGALLSNYNIHLSEDPSSTGAVQAAAWSSQFYRSGEDRRPVSLPVSQGPVIQRPLLPQGRAVVETAPGAVGS